MYHGTNDAQPRNHQQFDLATFLGAIDIAASIGVDYANLTAVKKARAIDARRADLALAFSSEAKSAAARMVDLGQQYAQGKVDPTAMVRASIEAAVLTGDLVDTARQHLAHASVAADAEGVRLLRTIKEADWIAPLRSPVADALAEANAQADLLGISAPLSRQKGVRSTQHPWAPTSTDLAQLEVRHAWERLGAALDRFDELHGVATLLRDNRVIPTVSGRDWCEDYRWLDLSVLRGAPGEQREFFLANREEGQPGIYTSAELAEKGRTTHSREAGQDRLTPSAVA